MTLVFALAGHLRYGAVLGIICTYIALAFLVEFCARCSTCQTGW